MFDEKRLQFLIDLSSYKPRYVFIRLLIITVVSIILIHVSQLLADEPPIHDKLQTLAYFIAAIAFNSIMELNLLLMRILNRIERYKWNIYLQAISVIGLSMLLIFVWFQIARKVFGDENILDHGITQIVLITGLLILIIHLLIIIITHLGKEWINNRKEIDELKQAKLISDYNSLKDRLNPHFMFNNLSVLKSMIRFNPHEAETFTQNFTNVYRYVLKSHEEKTVSLQEELRFIESYIALHKERIGEGLQVVIDVDEALLQRAILPMSLQLLVENAIKHNIANKQNPLKIEIVAGQQSLFVKNNRNHKASTYSTNTGLQTLQSQYKLIADEQIKIEAPPEYYKVTLPLL
ncbi:MAG TPA: histidine kinase [Bacteroidales bacterium]|nr:histidine kinase [Bacteroidales bacterium]